MFITESLGNELNNIYTYTFGKPYLRSNCDWTPPIILGGGTSHRRKVKDEEISVEEKGRRKGACKKTMFFHWYIVTGCQ